MRPAVVTTIKNVVIPVEHGASVMLGESLLAGLLIGASGKGIFPAVGWVFLFLMSTPLKIAIKDISRHIFNARTSVAVWCCAGFGIFALGFFAMTYYYTGSLFCFALLAVIPLGVVHLWSVVKGGKKELIAELFGALSLGGAAASIVLAAGHSYVQALALWVALAVRAMTSVIYVREQLRYHRGDAHDFRTVISVHVAGFALLLVLMAAHLVKPLICFAAFLLLARLCFMHERSVISAKALGLRESALGIIYVVLLLLAFSH